MQTKGKSKLLGSNDMKAHRVEEEENRIDEDEEIYKIM